MHGIQNTKPPQTNERTDMLKQETDSSIEEGNREQISLIQKTIGQVESKLQDQDDLSDSDLKEMGLEEVEFNTDMTFKSEKCDSV